MCTVHQVVQSLENQGECDEAAMQHAWEGSQCIKVVRLVQLIVRELLGDLDIDGRVILTEILDEVCC